MVRQIDPDKPIYPIGIVAELTGIKPQTLRIYEENGLVKPFRSETNRRLYSNNDTEKLEYIHYLSHVRKVGIPGVKVILELLERMTPEQRERVLSEARKEIERLQA